MHDHRGCSEAICAKGRVGGLLVGMGWVWVGVGWGGWCFVAFGQSMVYNQLAIDSLFG